MNILMVTKNLPYPLDDGDRLRLYNLAVHLAKNHRLFLFSLVNDSSCLQYKARLGDIFEEIVCCDIPAKGSNPLVKKWRDWRAKKTVETHLRDYMQRENFSVVHMHYWLPAVYSIDCAKESAPVVLDFVDSTHLALRRRRLPDFLHAPAQYLKIKIDVLRLYRIEKRLLQRASVASAVSPADVESLRQKAQDTAVEVIANGVDTRFFDSRELPAEVAVDPRRIVFVGNMDFLPNIDAVTYFVDKIFPHLKRAVPDVVFDIVGKNPVDSVRQLAAVEGVEVLGFVDDVRQYYQRAAVVVIPMISGGGIKNKVLEAFSMARPVVATALAVEAIDCHHQQQVWVADSAVDFTAAVRNLLDDVDLAEALGDAARQCVVEHYSWRSAAQRYDTLYRQLAGDDGGGDVRH